MISLLLLLACQGGDSPAAPSTVEAPAGHPFTLVYSADVEGEIEPCG